MLKTFLLSLGFIIWTADFGERTDIYIDEIRMGYSGVIVEKLLRRTTILRIKTDEGQVVEVGILCDKLKNLSKVEDLIEKIPNEEYVLISKDSVPMKLPYIY